MPIYGHVSCPIYMGRRLRKNVTQFPPSKSSFSLCQYMNRDGPLGAQTDIGETDKKGIGKWNVGVEIPSKSVKGRMKRKGG